MTIKTYDTLLGIFLFLMGIWLLFLAYYIWDRENYIEYLEIKVNNCNRVNKIIKI